jgi:hypothetical protein
MREARAGNLTLNFSRLLLEYNTGRRWYLLDSDDRWLFIGELVWYYKQKLDNVMVGAELTKWHGQAPRLRPDKIKSLCEGYHIDNELDHARLVTYISETIDLWRKGWGTKRGDQFFGEYSQASSTVDRVPVVFFLDRLDCLLQTANGNRRASEEGE